MINLDKYVLVKGTIKGREAKFFGVIRNDSLHLDSQSESGRKMALLRDESSGVYSVMPFDQFQKTFEFI